MQNTTKFIDQESELQSQYNNTQRQIIACLVNYSRVKTVLPISVSSLNERLFENDYQLLFIACSNALKSQKVIDRTYLEANGLGSWNDELYFEDIDFDNLVDFIIILKRKLDIIRFAKGAGNLSEEKLLSKIEQLGKPIELDNEYQYRTSKDILTSLAKFLNTKDTYLTTGFHNLDRFIGGFAKSGLHIIAARSSIGKTSFATTTFRKNIESGKNALFFSFEMKEEQITLKMMSQSANVSYGRLVKRELQQDDINRLHIAQGNMLKLETKFDIIDSKIGSFNFEKMVQIIRDYHYRNGLDMVVVDYIQLIPTKNGNKMDKRLEINYITSSLKQLSTELDISIVGLAQVSRAIEQRERNSFLVDEKIYPMPPVKEIKYRNHLLSDLKESGSIEQDADTVIFLDRDTVADANKESYGAVIISKVRISPTGYLGIIPIHFDKLTASYKDI